MSGLRAPDADPNDFAGATWIIIGAAVAAVLIVAWSLFALRDRRNKSRDAALLAGAPQSAVSLR